MSLGSKTALSEPAGAPNKHSAFSELAQQIKHSFRRRA
jgi:hypothetical protein